MVSYWTKSDTTPSFQQTNTSHSHLIITTVRTQQSNKTEIVKAHHKTKPKRNEAQASHRLWAAITYLERLNVQVGKGHQKIKSSRRQGSRSGRNAFTCEMRKVQKQRLNTMWTNPNPARAMILREDAVKVFLEWTSGKIINHTLAECL